MNKIVTYLVFLVFAASAISCTKADFNLSDDNLMVLHEKTFQISADKLIKIVAASGEITVTTWDKNEVYVKIYGNDNAKEKVDFEFINDGEQIEINAKSKSSFWGIKFRNTKMKFEVRVPKKFNTDFRTAGGDIFIENISGKQLLKTSGGDISARNIDGNFNASTSGGDYKIDNISGVIKISTSGGNIDAKNFTGDFNASTSGGNIRLSSSDAKIKASTSGGNINLIYDGENKGIELSSSGGDIDIIVPSLFSAAAELKTSGGSIDCDFKGNNAVKISSTKFEADINNGGNPLIAKTSGGDIEVHKK